MKFQHYSPFINFDKTFSPKKYKKILWYCLIVLILSLVYSFTAQAQRDAFPPRQCGSHDKLMEFKQSNPDGYNAFLNARRIALEEANRKAAERSSASCCPNGTIQIPIAFHIVHDGSPIGSGTNFSLAQIQEVVDVLNEDFGGYNADKDVMPDASDPSNFQQIDAMNTCIQFCIGLVDRAQDPGGGEDLSTVIPSAGRNNYLNMWVGSDASLGGNLGYAYLAGSVPAGSAGIDGVYINDGYFAPSVSGAPYNLGRTTTHEVGHYYGLEHTFDNGCTTGDGIADTPPQTTSTGGCPSHPYTGGGCGATATNPTLFYNYMDYSNDACLVMFTQGQAAVMNGTSGALNSTRVITGGACDESLMSTACPIVSATTINETVEFCSTGGELNLLDYQAAAFAMPTSTTCYLWSETGVSGASTSYPAKTIVPAHSGASCEPETITYTLAIDCPTTGTSTAESAGTVTALVYPDPSILTNYYTIADGACNGPTITLDPTACSSYITIAQNGGPTFPISTTSSGNVNYDVTYNLGGCCVVSGGTAGANLVADPSFEGGSPNASWNENSANFGSPLCSAASCGSGTGNTGDFFIWGGGTAGGDSGFVEQAITFPSTNATLEFYISCSAGAAGNTVSVTVDGNSEYATTAAGSDCTGNYQLVSIDLSAYADGAAHTVQIAYNTIDGQSFFIDDVSLFETTGATNPCITTASANYNCSATACPTATPVADGSTTSCSNVVPPNDFNVWQTAVAAANPMGLVYSSVTPIAGTTAPDEILPSGNTPTGCTAVDQIVMAYVYCDVDGSGTDNAGDTYTLVSTYTLTVNPGTPTPALPTVNGCTTTIVALCPNDVYGTNSNVSGGASVANFDTTTGIYTAQPGDAAGVIEVTITNEFDCRAVTYIVQTPACSSACPTATPVADNAATICSGALANEITDWQTTVAAANTMGLVYSSVTPVAGTTTPDEILPSGAIPAGCAAVDQVVMAYVYCDVDGSGTDNAGDIYTLVSTYTLTVNPTSILTGATNVNGCTVFHASLCPNDTYSVGTTITGGASAANLDLATGIYTAQPGDAAGSIEVLVTNEFSCGVANVFYPTPACTAACPTATTVTDDAATICSGALANEITDWQTTVAAANTMGLVYSSVTPVAGTTTPDGILPSGAIPAGCAAVDQVVMAYVYCDVDGSATDNAGDTYTLVSTYTLTVNPDTQTPLQPTATGCAVTLVPLCTNDVMVPTANVTGDALAANFNTATGTYTAQPGDAAGTIEITITNEFSCAPVNFTLNTPSCSTTPSSLEIGISDPCVCVNNASIKDLDTGLGGDDGQFFEVISITGPNNTPIADASLDIRVLSVSGGTDAFAIAPIPPAQTAGTSIAAGTSLVYNASTGFYELPFYHVDGTGYTAIIEQYDAGGVLVETYTISNTCSYPDPIFNPSLQDTYCPGSPAVVLGGTNLNGLAAENQSFTVDGVAASSIDVPNLASGTYTVSMTWEGQADGNAGVSPDGSTPVYPGCIQEVVGVVSIAASETVTITPVPTICASDLPVAIAVSPIGGILSGPGIDALASTFDPSLVGEGMHAISYIYTSPDGCIGIDQINILVEGNPEVEAGISTSICSQGTVNLAELGAFINGAAGGTWSSTTGGVFDDASFALGTTYTPSASDISNGSFILILTSSAAEAGFCGENSDTIEITIRQLNCSNFPWGGN